MEHLVLLPLVSGMSVEAVVGDIKIVLGEIFGAELPQMVLIGHSMGGSTSSSSYLIWPTSVIFSSFSAMAIHSALELKTKVQAMVVIDVVEGTAMEALPKMLAIVQARPQKFADLKSAIFWA